MKKLDKELEDICSLYMMNYEDIYNDDTPIAFKQIPIHTYRKNISIIFLSVVGILSSAISIYCMGPGVFNVFTSTACTLCLYCIFDQIIGLITLENLNTAIKNVNKNILNIITVLMQLAYDMYDNNDDEYNATRCVFYLNRCTCKTLNSFILEEMAECKNFVMYDLVSRSHSTYKLPLNREYFKFKKLLIG